MWFELPCCSSALAPSNVQREDRIGPPNAGYTHHITVAHHSLLPPPIFPRVLLQALQCVEGLPPLAMLKPPLQNMGELVMHVVRKPPPNLSSPRQWFVRLGVGRFEVSNLITGCA